MPSVPWWRSAVVYQIYPALVRRHRRRRRRRPRGHPAAPRSSRLARRRRDLALARLPLADGRLRLRRQRLLRRRSAVRIAGRPGPARRGGARARAARACSTGCRTTPPTSIRGSSSRAARATEPRSALVRVARSRSPTADRRTTGPRRSRPRRAPGRSTRRPASTTCTASCRRSPISTGRIPRSSTAMHGVVRFWLDRGIDGFRIDVVHCLGKDPALPDDPPDLAALPHAAINDHPSTHAILRELRRLVDAIPRRSHAGRRGVPALPAGRHALLRVGRRAAPGVRPARGRCTRRGSADAWRERIAGVQASHAAGRGVADAGAVEPRHAPAPHAARLGRARARAAAVLLLTLPGTPFLYAGEELGLEDAVVPRERRVDPGGRDGCRAPIPWDASPRHGWAGEPWLPWPPRRRAPRGRRAARRSVVDPAPLSRHARGAAGVAGAARAATGSLRRRARRRARLRARRGSGPAPRRW